MVNYEQEVIKCKCEITQMYKKKDEYMVGGLWFKGLVQNIQVE